MHACRSLHNHAAVGAAGTARPCPPDLCVDHAGRGRAGDVYVGSWKDGAKFGEGMYAWADGSKYIGNNRKGGMAGEGYYVWSTGDRYVGDFAQNQPDGYGTHWNPKGDKYIGEWRGGRRHGECSAIRQPARSAAHGAPRTRTSHASAAWHARTCARVLHRRATARQVERPAGGRAARVHGEPGRASGSLRLAHALEVSARVRKCGSPGHRGCGMLMHDGGWNWIACARVQATGRRLVPTAQFTRASTATTSSTASCAATPLRTAPQRLLRHNLLLLLLLLLPPPPHTHTHTHTHTLSLFLSLSSPPAPTTALPGGCDTPVRFTPMAVACVLP